MDVSDLQTLKLARGYLRHRARVKFLAPDRAPGRRAPASLSGSEGLDQASHEHICCWLVFSILICQPHVSVGAFRRQDSKMGSMTACNEPRRFLTCSIGVSIKGDPNHTTLVFLHGSQDTAADWASVAERLPNWLQVVIPNLRGRSGSFAPPDTGMYRLDGLAEDLAGLLTVLPGKIWLCGWSMGVLVTLEYIRNYGQSRLAGLILVSGTTRLDPQAGWFAEPISDSIALKATEQKRSPAMEAASLADVASTWLSARQADYRRTAAKIRVPTLVAHGSMDERCPLSHGEEIAAQIPGSRFEIFPGFGHNLMNESPDRLAQAITMFLAAQKAAEVWSFTRYG